MSDRWISRASNRLPRTAEVPISSPRHAPTSTAHSARALQQAISHSTPTPHSTAKASTGVSPRTLSDALRWTGRRGRGAYCGPTLRTPSGLDPSSPPRPPILTPPNPRLLYSHTAGSALGPSGRVAEPDASQMRAATCATARYRADEEPAEIVSPWRLRRSLEVAAADGARGPPGRAWLPGRAWPPRRAGPSGHYRVTRGPWDAGSACQASRRRACRRRALRGGAGTHGSAPGRGEASASRARGCCRGCCSAGTHRISFTISAGHYESSKRLRSGFISGCLFCV